MPRWAARVQQLLPARQQTQKWRRQKDTRGKGRQERREQQQERLLLRQLERQHKDRLSQQQQERRLQRRPRRWSGQLRRGACWCAALRRPWTLRWPGCMPRCMQATTFCTLCCTWAEPWRLAECESPGMQASRGGRMRACHKPFRLAWPGTWHWRVCERSCGGARTCRHCRQATPQPSAPTSGPAARSAVGLTPPTGQRRLLMLLALLRRVPQAPALQHTR